MKQPEKSNAKQRAMTRALWIWAIVALAMATLNSSSYAEQPPAPCFPNPHAALNRDLIKNRGDIRNLPATLRERIVRMADPGGVVLCVAEYLSPRAGMPAG